MTFIGFGGKPWVLCSPWKKLTSSSRLSKRRLRSFAAGWRCTYKTDKCCLLAERGWLWLRMLLQNTPLPNLMISWTRPTFRTHFMKLWLPFTPPDNLRCTFLLFSRFWTSCLSGWWKWRSQRFFQSWAFARSILSISLPVLFSQECTDILLQDLGRQIGEIRRGVNDAHKHVSHPTIFHEVLNSDLPLEEKSDARLGDEAQLIVAAGLITTSWALTVASFHIINNSNVSQRLRTELETIVSTSSSTFDWHKLEQLPYLNGCVHEAVRLAHGVSTRSPRLAPLELKYADWVIPANTPISMTNVDILMDESIFPNAKDFVPERWIDRPDLDRFFVPFGKGSRACAGIK